MQKIKKLTSILCAVSILCGMMLTAPTAFAAGEAQWVERAPMPEMKCLFTAETVNGKIYTFGGNSNGAIVSDMNIYDPQTNKWATGAPMLAERYNNVSEVVDGKIYLIGGLNGYGDPIKSMEIYDSATNAWASGTAPQRDLVHASSTVIGGKIYVIGGADMQLTAYDSLEIFDTETNTWMPNISIPTPRCGHISEAVNGKIYVIGGRASNLEYLKTVEIYNSKTNTWSSGTPAPVSLCFSVSVSVGNKIYVMGGISNGASLNSVYIYDTVSDSWSVGPDMVHARYYLGAACINNTIYAIGGHGSSQLNSMEALALSTTAEHKLAVLLNIDETAQLSVSHDLSDNTSLTWASSDQSVATVDANGKVTAIGQGLCEISAQNADGTWKQSIPVRVLPGTADLFRLAVHLKPTQNAKLYLTEDPADTTWKSLDPAVATVDATGKVTSVSQGLVIMEGTADGETRQIYVRVKG